MTADPCPSTSQKRHPHRSQSPPKVRWLCHLGLAIVQARSPRLSGRRPLAISAPMQSLLLHRRGHVAISLCPTSVSRDWPRHDDPVIGIARSHRPAFPLQTRRPTKAAYRKLLRPSASITASGHPSWPRQQKTRLSTNAVIRTANQPTRRTWPTRAIAADWKRGAKRRSPAPRQQMIEKSFASFLQKRRPSSLLQPARTKTVDWFNVIHLAARPKHMRERHQAIPQGRQQPVGGQLAEPLDTDRQLQTPRPPCPADASSSSGARYSGMLQRHRRDLRRQHRMTADVRWRASARKARPTTADASRQIPRSRDVSATQIAARCSGVSALLHLSIRLLHGHQVRQTHR